MSFDSRPDQAASSRPGSRHRPPDAGCRRELGPTLSLLLRTTNWLRPFRLVGRLPPLASRFARHGCPARTLLFGPLSLGDDLLCTTVLREARRRGIPFSMMTGRPEIFANNPDPSGLIPVDDYYARALRRLGRTVVRPYYADADPDEPNRDVFGPGHILASMCRRAGLTGEIALRPYVFLTDAELAAGLRAGRQIAMQSTVAGSALPFANKEWLPARFAEVVNRLPEGCTAIQLGSASDPPLPRALDLRGRTSVREAAAVLAASEAFVGLEGFLGHLARAVDCPAVILLGGRATAENLGYPGNEYLAAPTSCAPCGLRNRCDHSRACLADMEVEAVAAALRRLLDRGRRPLPVARAIL